MRGLYVAPTQTQFDSLFSNRGGGLDDIRTYDPHQRGGSLFGIIGKLVRGAIPFLKNIFLPEIPDLVTGVTEDMNSGVRFKDSLKKRGIKTAINVGNRMVRKARGGRKKKPKKQCHKQIKKTAKTKKAKKKKVKFIAKRTKADVFDGIL